MIQPAAPVSNSSSSNRLSLSNHLAVLAYFLIATLCMTYPLITQPHRMILGSPGDSLIFAWNNWWAQKALVQEHHLPFFGDIILRPFEIPMMHHTHTYFYGLIYCAGSFLYANPIFWMNLCILGSFTIAGYGMFILAEYLTRDALAGLIAGTIYAFCSYRMIRVLGHLNLLSNEWIPVYAYCVIRGLSEARLKFFLGAAAAFAATLWNDYTNTLFIVLFTGFYLCFLPFLKNQRPIYSRKLAFQIGGGVALLVLLISPFVWGMFKTVETMNVVAYGGLDQFHASPLAYLLPSAYHRLFMQQLLPLYASFPGNQGEATVFLGYSALALGVFGFLSVRNRPPHQLFFLLAAIAFFILSLGTSVNLHWGSREIRIPLPYRFITALPFLRDFRVPARMGLMVLFCIAVLAAYGFNILRERMASHRSKITLFGIAIAAILFENCHAPIVFHYDGMDPKIIPFGLARKIADDPIEGAVLDIPFYPRDYRSAWIQMFHNKPAVTGTHTRLGGERAKYYADLDLSGWFRPTAGEEKPVTDPLAPESTNPILNPRSLGRDADAWNAENLRRLCYFFDLRHLLLPKISVDYDLSAQLRKDLLPIISEETEDGSWMGIIEKQKCTLPLRIDPGLPADSIYFLSGFDPAEKGYRRGTGSASVIAFRLDQPTGLILNVRLRCQASSFERRPALSILLNHQPLNSQEITTETLTLKTDLPIALTRGGYNYLESRPQLNVLSESASVLFGPIEISETGGSN